MWIVITNIRGSSPILRINLCLEVLKICAKNVRTIDRCWLFKIATLNRVRRFGLNGIRSLSKPGAIMHPFEPHFSLQGAFYGKSDLSVCSNMVCEATDKYDVLIGGGQLVVQGVKRWYFERNTPTLGGPAQY